MKSTFRNSFILLICLTLLFGAVSCKKDEKECTPPALESQIVGTWQTSIGTLVTLPLTFTSSGELQGNNLNTYLSMLQPGAEVDELVKYEVTGDTGVNLVATSKGQALPPFALTVKERTCEKIVFTSLAGDITLSK